MCFPYITNGTKEKGQTATEKLEKKGEQESSGKKNPATSAGKYLFGGSGRPGLFGQGSGPAPLFEAGAA